MVRKKQPCSVAPAVALSTAPCLKAAAASQRQEATFLFRIAQGLKFLLTPTIFVIFYTNILAKRFLYKKSHHYYPKEIIKTSSITLATFQVRMSHACFVFFQISQNIPFIAV